MRSSVTTVLIFMIFSILWAGCSKETVEPQRFGSIEGRVKDSETGAGIANASITTNPGTNALLTDENGNFSIDDISTGNYVVQAEKKDYNPKTVRVSVVENKTASAKIQLESTNDAPTSDFIHAEVTSFANTSRNDSSFAEVSYRVTNDSDDQSVQKFEVYFKIYTPGTTFYSEIKGDTLDSRQESIGDFTKYIRQATADSVVVSGVYAPDS